MTCNNCDMEQAIAILDEEIREKEATIGRWQLNRKMGSASAVIIIERLTSEIALLEKVREKIEHAMQSCHEPLAKAQGLALGRVPMQEEAP